MNLSQLRAIVTVADCKNFSEAALLLNVNQSSVSYAIAALEDELGVPLFMRGRHGATVTPAGEKITRYAREVLQLIELMQREANLQKSLQGGQVRVAAFRSVATHVLPRIIAQFRQEFPAVELQLVEGNHDNEVATALREHRADIGFMELPAPDEFDTWEFMRDEYLVLLPPGVTPRCDLLTWSELAALPLILPPAQYACDIALHKHLEAVAPPLNVAHIINQDSTIVNMVRQGLAAAILPRLAAEPIPESIQVCSLPVPFERVIGVATLSNKLHVPAVFAFLKLLKLEPHQALRKS
ncbi:LysR family transcriptional regulator [Oscillatoria sp. FACHB-1407]|uniref:LysR family transcriptional regulator n=1 Tax=Oscillatoria sp. FACHB-1407 TaxID=2692847 RepID=UPI0016839973|nr:LysR family transcriptional regulator [Oscillatoria sp. FACHB-1407]MBD2460785.1 LysR family transcriptional regulator [Oscillatoria sp. FACHB-1407]